MTTAKPDLTTRSMNGFAWVLSGSLVQAALKIAVLALLARLVTPGDFGVLGACMMLFALAETFTQVGVAPALIQKRELSAADIDTGYTLTLVMGGLVMVAVLLGAPWLAQVLRFPQAVAPFRAVGLIFPVIAFGAVSQALLARAMRFRLRATIDLASYVLGYAVLAPVMAWMGYAYWALIVGQMAQLAIGSLWMLLSVGPLPRLRIVRSSVRALMSFGFGITIARIGNAIALNGDYFVVGRWLGADALGLYTRAYTLTQQPIKIFGSLGDQVLFPAMASIQTERERVARAYEKSTMAVLAVAGPLCGALYVMAPDVVSVLLGSSWGPLIPAFQFLACSLPFRIVYKFSGTVLRAEGGVFFVAAWNWIYAASLITAAWLGTGAGIAGVAFGVGLAIIANHFLGAAIVRTRLPTSLLGEVIVVAKTFAAAATLGGVIHFVNTLAPVHAAPVLIRMAIDGAVAGLLYTTFIAGLPEIYGEDARWLREKVLHRTLAGLRRLPARLRRSGSGPHRSAGRA